MGEEESLLAAVRADPADQLARLVYADWLDDAGRADAAEYLRLIAEAERVNRRLAELADRLSDGWLTQLELGVFLRAYPPSRKIAVIRAIREHTGAGLAEAKQLAESVPRLFPFRGDAAACDRFRRQLRATGAEAD